MVKSVPHDWIPGLTHFKGCGGDGPEDGIFGFWRVYLKSSNLFWSAFHSILLLYVCREPLKLSWTPLTWKASISRDRQGAGKIILGSSLLWRQGTGLGNWTSLLHFSSPWGDHLNSLFLGNSSCFKPIWIACDHVSSRQLNRAGSGWNLDWRPPRKMRDLLLI